MACSFLGEFFCPLCGLGYTDDSTPKFLRSDEHVNSLFQCIIGFKEC